MERRLTSEDIRRLMHRVCDGSTTIIESRRLMQSDIRLHNRIPADGHVIDANVPYLIESPMVRRRRQLGINRYDNRFYYYCLTIVMPSVNVKHTIYQSLRSINKSIPIGAIDIEPMGKRRQLNMCIDEIDRRLYLFADYDHFHDIKVYGLVERCIDGVNVLKLKDTQPLMSILHQHQFTETTDKCIDSNGGGIFYFIGGIEKKQRHTVAHSKFVKMTIDIDNRRCTTQLIVDTDRRFGIVETNSFAPIRYRGALVGCFDEFAFKAGKGIILQNAIIADKKMKALKISKRYTHTGMEALTVIGRIGKYLLIYWQMDGIEKITTHLFAIRPNKTLTTVHQLIHIDMTNIIDESIPLATNNNVVVFLDSEQKLILECCLPTELSVNRIDIGNLFAKRCSVCDKVEKKKKSTINQTTKKCLYTVTDMMVCKICKAKHYHKDWFKYKCHFCSLECFRRGWNRHKNALHYLNG